MQYIHRLTEGATAILALTLMPTHCHTGAMPTTRQNHAERARLQQAAHPTSIAGCTRRWFGRRVRVNQNDLVYLGHGTA
jgi:hypothetical protein